MPRPAPCRSRILFFYTAPPLSALSTLSLHDALPIFGFTRCEAELTEQSCLLVTSNSGDGQPVWKKVESGSCTEVDFLRSEEHTSELQSRFDLVCRLLLEKKKDHLPGTQVSQLHIVSF